MKLLLAVDAEGANAVAVAAAKLFPEADYVVFNSVPFLRTVVPDTLVSGAGAMVPTEEAVLAAEAEGDAASAAAQQALPSDATEAVSTLGDPGPSICEEAVAISADVVVLGRSGRGWLSKLFAPSVAEYVVRHAPCPVLVVRHDAEVLRTG